MLSSASEIVSIISTELKPWMESLIRNRWLEFKVKKKKYKQYLRLRLQLQSFEFYLIVSQSGPTRSFLTLESENGDVQRVS